MNNEIIEMCRLNSLNIKVSEPINGKYLKDFIMTAFQNSGYVLSKNSKVFYTYLDTIKEYQISYFDSSYVDNVSIIELIPIQDDEATLIVTENFFCVFINQVLYYYQKIESMMTLHEFKTYVDSKLKIKIEQMKFISNEDLESIKNSEPKSSLTYLKQENYHSLKLYSTYLLALIFLYTFLNFWGPSQSVSNKDEVNFLQQKYNNLLLQKKLSADTSYRLVTLFNSIHSYGLHLEYIKVHDSHCFLRLKTVDKNHLYAFLKEYKNRVHVQSLYLDKGENLHVLDTRFKLY